jgi:hypothetical protein
LSLLRGNNIAAFDNAMPDVKWEEESRILNSESEVTGVQALQNTEASSLRRRILGLAWANTINTHALELLNSDPTSPFLATQTVKIDDHDDEAAGNDTLPEWIHVQQVCAVIDRRQDEGAEERAMDGADRTKKACAADD